MKRNGVMSVVKLLTFALLGLCVGVMLLVIYALDDWLGLLAYKTHYLAFCGLFSLAVFAIVRLAARRQAVPVAAGLIALALLITPYLIGTPSSRILRAVLIDVQPGMVDEYVEALVVSAYQDSGYAMPIITRETDRMLVSLQSQRVGDVTSAIFLLDNGVVVSDSFSPD